MIKNSQPFGKNFQKTLGGDFFWLTLYTVAAALAMLGDTVTDFVGSDS